LARGLPLLVLAGCLLSFEAAADFVPSKVYVVVQGPQDKIASGGIHRFKLSEQVSLFAVVEGKLGKQRVVITAADKLKVNGKNVPSLRIRRPSDFPKIMLRWYKVEPTGNSYDNTVGGFHWDTIEYREHAVTDWDTKWQITADAHPKGTYPDTHNGAGTMAFKVAIKIGFRNLASAGQESLERGGLDKHVPRVAFRRDDSYIGRLTELFNTPYIWGSAGVPPKVHQAERLIGSDCADFIVYGARRLGKQIPYRGSWHIPEVANVIYTAEKIDDQGRYLTKAKKTIPISKDGVQIGDLLLFHGHVGALAADRKPEGVLDINDIMIHTYWAPPDEQPISETAYAEAKVKILRWK
jgi:cell wall-associated NlpC family hydrolase